MNAFTPTRLRVRTLRDLLSEQFPTRHHLLHPIIRQGESCLLWAATGVGKTMLTLSMALAVSGGGNVLGWTAARRWRVLVVDGEMAIEDLQDRLRMLAPAVEGMDHEAAGANLAILARQDQARGAAFPDLATPEGQDAVIHEAHRHGADLVILDNFSTLAEVQDENEAGAMNPVLSFLLRLKQERIACILVHHSGKTGASYRGSSKLATTFEVILGLRPPEAEGAAKSAAFTTEWTKFRGAPHPTITPRDVVLTVDGHTVRWNVKEAEGDNARKLAATIRSADFATQAEVAKALGWSASTVSRTVPKAIASGYITDKEISAIFKAVSEARRASEEHGEF